MKRYDLLWLAGIVAVLVGPTVTIAGVTIINTTDDLSNVYNVNSFGEGTTPTYGQTITAPDNNILNSFRFKLGHGGDVPTTIRFFVMAWGGNNVSGPVLYQSEPVTLIESQFYQDYDIFTGGIPLVAGQQYVLFFTSFLDFDGVNDASSALARHYSTDPYTGGQFVLNNGATSLAGLAATPWQTDFLGSGDLAFRASFSTSPPGDYNGDHVVDAADYVMWNKIEGIDVSWDVVEYSVWRSHFGEVASDGGGASIGSIGSPGSKVPEPTSQLLVLMSCTAAIAIRRKR